MSEKKKYMKRNVVLIFPEGENEQSDERSKHHPIHTKSERYYDRS